MNTGRVEIYRQWLPAERAIAVLLTTDGHFSTVPGSTANTTGMFTIPATKET